MPEAFTARGNRSARIHEMGMLSSRTFNIVSFLIFHRDSDLEIATSKDSFNKRELCIVSHLPTAQGFSLSRNCKLKIKENSPIGLFLTGRHNCRYTSFGSLRPLSTNVLLTCYERRRTAKKSFLWPEVKEASTTQTRHLHDDHTIRLRGISADISAYMAISWLLVVSLFFSQAPS